jgi:hypothetical protein
MVVTANGERWDFIGHTTVRQHAIPASSAMSAGVLMVAGQREGIKDSLIKARETERERDGKRKRTQLWNNRPHTYIHTCIV